MIMLIFRSRFIVFALVVVLLITSVSLVSAQDEVFSCIDTHIGKASELLASLDFDNLAERCGSTWYSQEEYEKRGGPYWTNGINITLVEGDKAWSLFRFSELQEALASLGDSFVIVVIEPARTCDADSLGTMFYIGRDAASIRRHEGGGEFTPLYGLEPVEFGDELNVTECTVRTDENSDQPMVKFDRGWTNGSLVSPFPRWEGVETDETEAVAPQEIGEFDPDTFCDGAPQVGTLPTEPPCPMFDPDGTGGLILVGWPNGKVYAYSSYEQALDRQAATDGEITSLYWNSWGEAPEISSPIPMFSIAWEGLRRRAADGSVAGQMLRFNEAVTVVSINDDGTMALLDDGTFVARAWLSPAPEDYIPAPGELSSILYDGEYTPPAPAGEGFNPAG